MLEVKIIASLSTITNANAGDLGQGIVRMNTQTKEAKAQGIERNTLVSIRNRHQQRKIYAIVRTNNTLNKDTIALEHDQRLALSGVKDNLDSYEVKKASFWGYFEYFRKHPNPQTRLTFIMGLFANAGFTILGAAVGYMLSVIM